jgi:hypothetical protein
VKLRALVIPYSWLAFAVVLAYGPYLNGSVYADDWYIIWRLYSDPGWVLAGPDIARPLEYAVFSVAEHFLGISPLAWRLLLLVLHWISGCLLYTLLIRLFPAHRWSALACALLFLVYPSVLTHTWLAFMNPVAVACLVLLYAHLLLRYVQRGSVGALAAALVLLLVQLLMYEAQLGLVIAWALLVLFVSTAPVQRRLTAAAATLLICIPYTAWRAYMALQVANSAVKYSLGESMSAETLLHRLIAALKVQVWAWSEPLHSHLPAAATGILLLSLLAAVTVAGLLGYLWQRAQARGGRLYLQWPSWKTSILAAVGVLLMVIGYLPALVYWDATLDGVLTRINYFPAIGAAVAIVACLNLAAEAFTKQRQAREYLVMAAALPLISLGILTQVETGAHAAAAWQEQQDLWVQLQQAAPDLAPHSSVYVVMPQCTDRFGFVNYRRSPLLDSHDVTMALRVLYGDDTLSGDVL